MWVAGLSWPGTGLAQHPTLLVGAHHALPTLSHPPPPHRRAPQPSADRQRRRLRLGQQRGGAGEGGGRVGGAAMAGSPTPLPALPRLDACVSTRYFLSPPPSCPLPRPRSISKLGEGTTSASSAPVLVAGPGCGARDVGLLQPVTAIAAGARHSACINAMGQCLVWGWSLQVGGRGPCDVQALCTAGTGGVTRPGQDGGKLRRHCVPWSAFPHTGQHCHCSHRCRVSAAPGAPSAACPPPPSSSRWAPSSAPLWLRGRATQW